MIRLSSGRGRPGVLTLGYRFRAFRLLGVGQLEHAVDGPAGAFGAGRREVRVGPQREARITRAMLSGSGTSRVLPWLWRPEHQTAAHDLDLPNDLDRAIDEVHLINAQPEHLALS